MLPQQKFVLFPGSRRAFRRWDYVRQTVERLGGACTIETVYGYVTLITIYNLSRTLLNICVPSHCRSLNTLAWWSAEAAHWLNG